MSVFNENGEVIYLNEYYTLIMPSELKEKVNTLNSDLEDLKKMKSNDNQVIDTNKLNLFTIKSKKAMSNCMSVIKCISIGGFAVSLTIFLINPIISVIGIVLSVAIITISTPSYDNATQKWYKETVDTSKNILEELKKIKKASKDKTLNNNLDIKIKKITDILKQIDKLEKKYDKESDKWDKEIANEY